MKAGKARAGGMEERDQEAEACAHRGHGANFDFFVASANGLRPSSHYMSANQQHKNQNQEVVGATCAFSAPARPLRPVGLQMLTNQIHFFQITNQFYFFLDLTLDTPTVI
jgi:hypothetical protein